jgi:hypothetical protein
MDRRSKVMALVGVREESVARLASLPALATFLEERRISSQDYVRLLQDKGASSKEPLLAIDSRVS